MEIQLTADNFDQEVLSSSIPVFVDFYADWCGPCKMMAPVVEALAEKYEGRLKVCKCNIDDEEGLANRYKIMSIPSMLLFAGGDVKDTTIGAVPQAELESKIEALLG